jgi:C-terminal processing protease CtpA/Prc
MNKVLKSLVLTFCFLFIFQSCSDDYDDVLHYKNTNEFIWTGLNQYYYWQKKSPDLVDGRFANDADFQNFLSNYTPESLFQHLRYEPGNVDKYSVLFSDYNILEAALQGTSKNTGADLGFKRKTPGSTEVFGFVRYILPNSDASSKNIHRGDIFYAVNGVPLTVNSEGYLNSSGLSDDTFTLNMADYDNGNITPNGNTIELTKTAYSENPVLIKNVHTVGTKKVGYLMYNGFYTNYENELNNAFAYFQSEGVTHLILDLRYNSGGSVNVATELASMITGQFNGQVFARQEWNEKRMSYYNSVNPDALINKFTNSLSNGNGINSLNLNKVYVLTTNSTASASELVINGLRPYINVTIIGSVTTGKNVGSITLYDSPTFRKENLNPNHKYAMQPIVLKIINKDGFGEYSNGFVPNVPLNEDYANLGVLGENTEPMLYAALNYINTNGRMSNNSNIKVFEHVTDSKNLDGIEKGMYLENLADLK